MATGAPDFHRNVNLYGFDGSILRLVRVDSDQGRIQAMLNAMYNSTPTPLKCDSSGQIQINLNAQGLDRVFTLPKVPSGGQRINISGGLSNGLGILRTIPAGKTLHILNAVMVATWYVEGEEGYLAIRDTGDNIVYVIAYVLTHVFGSICIPFSFPLGLDVPEGYDIILVSTDPDVAVSAYITGWED